jgi:hypothetical protein
VFGLLCQPAELVGKSMRSRSEYQAEPAHLGRFYAGFVAAGRGFVPPAYGQGIWVKGGTS